MRLSSEPLFFRFPFGGRGGGSPLPASEVVGHPVNPSLPLHWARSPKPHAREPPTVFFGGGLRYFGVIPIPSHVAPPGAMPRLPLGPLQHGDEGHRGAQNADETAAREPPAPGHGLGPGDSLRASPARCTGGENPCWLLEPVSGSPAAPWGLLRTAADALQRLGRGLPVMKPAGMVSASTLRRVGASFRSP